MSNKEATKERPVVMTRGIMVETHEGPVGAIVFPINHPRGHLNSAPYVNTSEVQEIRLITRNTEYVWKKSFGDQKEKVEHAEDRIPDHLVDSLITSNG
jgi:hypothetical protein